MTCTVGDDDKPHCFISKNKAISQPSVRSGNENIGCDTTMEVKILQADGEWIELLSVNLFMGSFDIHNDPRRISKSSSEVTRTCQIARMRKC